MGVGSPPPRLVLATVLFGLVAAVSAIYPEDHWKYSTKLDSSNIHQEIKKRVDEGSTLFVRFIASAG